MPLSPEEKERIIEEETLRHEARMQAHLRQPLPPHGGPPSPGPCVKDAVCSHCGRGQGCPGCRIWTWVFAAIVLLCLLRCLAWHYHACGCQTMDGHGMLDRAAPQSDAPAWNEGKPAPKK